MSASAIRRRTTSWPASSRRLRQMLSLLTFVLAAPMPAAPPTPIVRNGSPPGGSTLITRAPRSPRNDVPSGVAMIVENSSTVMPSSAWRGAGPTPFEDCHAGRGDSASTSSVCSPSCGSGRTGSAGVPVMRTIGPIWRMLPSRGCSTSSTCPFSTRSGSSSASCVLTNLVAATEPFSRKACIHAPASCSCMRRSMRSRSSSIASSDHVGRAPMYRSSAKISTRSAAVR